MQIRNGKDFWAGLMFIAFGALFFWLARSYPMGTALRMGPSYFPTVLSGMLVVLGLAVLARSFVSSIQSNWRLFAFRPVNFALGVLLGCFAYWQIRMQGSFDFFGDEVPAAEAAAASSMRMAWFLESEWARFAVIGSSIVLLFSSLGQRSLWQVLAATLAFGYLLKPLGLVAASFLLVLGTGLISTESRWKEVVILAGALSVFAWLTFIVGLGQPFPVMPAFLDE